MLYFANNKYDFDGWLEHSKVTVAGKWPCERPWHSACPAQGQSPMGLHELFRGCRYFYCCTFFIFWCLKQLSQKQRPFLLDQMLKVAVTGDSSFPSSARLSVQGGSLAAHVQFHFIFLCHHKKGSLSAKQSSCCIVHDQGWANMRTILHQGSSCPAVLAAFAAAPETLGKSTHKLYLK